MAKNLDEILSESAGLSEDLKGQLSGLWESKITEARAELSATLREEFARKFEHDKGVLVESMDRFLTDKIRAELEEFANDKRQLVAERIAYRKKLAEHTSLLNSFITEAVAKELKEFRSDKAAMNKNFGKLENFLLKQLAEEIHEFRADKQALVEQRVKMVADGKRHLQEAKRKFIQRAAQVVESKIENTLKREITQFKDDIRAARENEFGRKMFESFAAEFMTSYLNEGTALRKMQKVLESKEAEMKALKETVQKSKHIVESMDVKLKATQDLVERQRVMNELLAPLSKDKKRVMTELLESVQTKNLQNAYNRYLPSVLNEAVNSKTAERAFLNESSLTAKTGNRAVVAQPAESDEAVDLNKILSLAGIKK